MGQRVKQHTFLHRRERVDIGDILPAFANSFDFVRPKIRELERDRPFSVGSSDLLVDIAARIKRPANIRGVEATNRSRGAILNPSAARRLPT